MTSALLGHPMLPQAVRACLLSQGQPVLTHLSMTPPESPLRPRFGARESSSSKKIMQGAAALALANTGRTDRIHKVRKTQRSCHQQRAADGSQLPTATPPPLLLPEGSQSSAVSLRGCCPIRNTKDRLEGAERVRGAAAVRQRTDMV